MFRWNLSSVKTSFFTHLPEDPYEIYHVMDCICDDLTDSDLGLILKKKIDKISDVLILSDVDTEMGRKSLKIPLKDVRY